MVGEIEFIDLHRDPYTNKCKVGPQPRFLKASFVFVFGMGEKWGGGEFSPIFLVGWSDFRTELARFLYEFAMSFLWSLCVFFEG